MALSVAQATLARLLPRELVLDLLDMSHARSRSALELIRDHTDLKGRQARALEGQARFRLMEKGFVDACEKHGGISIEAGVLPGTDLRFFQPFIRFGGGDCGVVLSLASMPDPGELPRKNRSREVGVTLNYGLTPRLDLDENQPKAGDVFATLLVARDRGRAGKILEVALGVLDTEYTSFLMYETVNDFVALYDQAKQSTASAEVEPLVKLRRTTKTFTPLGSASRDKAEGEDAG